MAMDQMMQRGPMRGEATLCKEPRPVSVIEMQLQNMDDRINSLGKRIEVLSNKINGVLRMEGPETNSSACPIPPTAVPLGDALASNNNRLLHLIERLDNINERIEL